MNQENYNKTFPNNEIDEILHMLVFNYDNEELSLKRDIQKSKHIIEENGDMTKALKEFEKTSIALENTNDLYTHITNIAITKNIVVSNINTKKLAISLSKEFIAKGYNKISRVDGINTLPDLNININEWNGLTKNGSNEEELQKSLANHLEDRFHDEVYSDHLFNTKMLFSIILGLILIFASIAFNQYILGTVIFSVVLIYNIVEFLRAYSKQEAKVKQLNDIKKQQKILLSNILAEIVDYYFIYKDNVKTKEEFTNYINQLNYTNYIDINSTRNIIVEGEK